MSSEIIVARYKSGSADDNAVNQKIAAAWASLVSEHRDEVAQLLEVSPGSLDPKKPPFRVRTNSGGISGVEILVIFATAALAEIAKEIAKEGGATAAKEGIKKLKQLWTKYVAKGVSNPRDPALGNMIDEDG